MLKYPGSGKMPRNSCLPVLIVSMLVCLGAMGKEVNHDSLLKDFDWRLEQRSVTDREDRTPEAQAILDEGVAILPRLIERFREMDESSPRARANYRFLIQRISGIESYLYTSKEKKQIGLIDFHDPDLESISPYSYDFAVPYTGDPYAEFLEHWDSIVGLDDPSIRVEKMRSITQGLDPIGEQLTGRKWREYERSIGTLGIFNLPVYIEQVAKHDDPIAFADFLRVTNHPAYLQSDFRANHLHVERVWEAAAEFPEHTERVEVITAWWEHRSSGFRVFPKLHAAIETSMQTIDSE